MGRAERPPSRPTPRTALEARLTTIPVPSATRARRSSAPTRASSTRWRPRARRARRGRRRRSSCGRRSRGFPCRPRPSERLTALFELARFSERPLGAEARDAACDCLDAITTALDAESAPCPLTDPSRRVAVRSAALGGVVLFATVPVYVYVEPSWRAVVARAGLPRSCSAWRSCSSARAFLDRLARSRRLGARRRPRPARARARRPASLPGPGQRRAHRAPQPALLRQGAVAAADRADDRGRCARPAARPGRGPSLASLRRVIAAIEKQP